MHEAFVVVVESLISFPVCDFGIWHAAENLTIDLGVIFGDLMPDIVVEGRDNRVNDAIVVDFWSFNSYTAPTMGVTTFSFQLNLGIRVRCSSSGAEFIKVKDGKETLAYYEVLLVTADKKTLEVVVTADGKITKTEDKKEEKEEKK